MAKRLEHDKEVMIIADWTIDRNISRVARENEVNRRTVMRVLDRLGIRDEDMTLEDCIRDGLLLSKRALQYANSRIDKEILLEEIGHYEAKWFIGPDERKGR